MDSLGISCVQGVCDEWKEHWLWSQKSCVYFLALLFSSRQTWDK